MFSGVLRAEDIIGIRKSGSGDTTVVDEQTLLETFLNMSLRSACFNDIVFFFMVKSKTFVLGTTLLKYWTVRISKL